MSLTPRLDRLERNLIINGGHDFWQRNNNFTNGAGELAGYQSVDRWLINTFNTSGTRRSSQQSGDTPNETGSDYLALLDFTSTGSAAFDLRQKIESDNCRHVAGGKLSFSFWYKTDEFQQVRVRLFKATAGKDDWATSSSFYDQTFSASTSGTWQQLVIEGIDVDSDATNGIELIISGSTPLNGSGARFFRWAQVMLVEGDTAKDFKRAGRTIGEELALCQRYYEKSGDIDSTASVGPPILVFPNLNFMTTSGIPPAAHHFQTRKRKTPSIYLWDQVGNGGLGVSSARISTVATGGAATNNVTVGSLTGRETHFYWQMGASGSFAGYYVSWAADAEL